MLIAIGAFLLVAVLLMVPIPIRGRLTSSLMDLVHAPMFALLAWILLQGLQSHAQGRWLPGSFLNRLLLIAIPLGICGAGMEWLQASVGRGSSWHDARANLCGALVGVLLYELTNRKKTALRPLLIMGVCLLFAIPSFYPIRVIGDYLEQRNDFPLLASFESELAARRFIPLDARTRRTSKFVTDGDWALEIELLPGNYSGVLIDGLPGDWARYRTLEFDLYVDDGPSLNLIVKVFDAEHPSTGYDDTDRFDKMFHLTPGRHHISISLADVESAPQRRFMNMQQIEAWQLFCYGLQAPRTVILDNLRLEE